MKKLLIIACGLSLLAGPALAQACCGPDYFQGVREGNALRDSARAQERQADSLRNIERMEHDRSVREDRAQRTYNQDRRDSYRR